MKRIYALLICFSALYHLCAQDDLPTAAPKINAFNLNADNLGAIASSVNLFTGDLALPMNLVSIPGQGGIGIDVSIFYSSAGMENMVDVWNLDSPTGTLGLGWSMPVSQIIVDNKQTGARDDDEFYLVDGGVSTRLVCTGNSSGVKSYKTKTYSNSIITYTASTERWEITKDDGTRVIYGDQNSGRNTVQWIVKWGNWIGSSKLAANQSRQGLVWNISEVKNLWGGRAYYSYTNVENVVGEGTLYHTEASYLTNVSDSWGHSVDFIYKEKLAQEYTEPHTEQQEPDAFQDRYEKKFLDKITVKTDGVAIYDIAFRYATHLLGTGNLTKRLLKSITKITTGGMFLPVTSFDYLTSGVMKGAMNIVQSQTGASVTFEYDNTGIVIGHSARDSIFSAPAGYAEPRVFIENDYTMVTWRAVNGTHVASPRDVTVEAYTWEGEWKKSDFGSIGTATVTGGMQDFKVATARDFFAILKDDPGYTSPDRFELFLWHRNERVPGKWDMTVYPINIGTHTAGKEEVFCGDGFVVVSNNNGKLFRYSWNGISYWIADEVNESADRHFTSAGGNFIISHNTGPDPDQINFYYLDETKTWQTKSLTAPFNNGSSDSFWYSDNSLAVGMIHGTNEYILRWDENYNLNVSNVGFGYPDNSSVFINDGSQITFITPSGSTTMRSLRFNGSAWSDTGDKAVYDVVTASVGSDYLLWHTDAAPPDQVAYRKFYNANSGLWGVDISISYSSYVWNSTRAGIRNFVQNDKVYFGQPNGSWADVSSPFTRTVQTSARIGLNYFALSYYGYEIQFLKNNQLANSVADLDRPYYLRDSNLLYQALITYNTMLTVNIEQQSQMENVNSFKIHRIQKFAVTGKQNKYPVIKVTTNDGIKNYYTSYAYDETRATLEPGGTSAIFNKITTIPGSSTPSARPFGYTETYFYNALSKSELSDSFPDASDVPFSAIDYNFKLATGMIYRSKVFNSNADLVAEKNTTYTFPEYTIYDDVTGTRIIDTGKMPRFFLISSKRDNIVDRITSYEYNTKQQVSRISEYNDQDFWLEPVESEFTYAWEQSAYAGMLEKNIISPVVQIKKSQALSPTTEISIIRWKDWPCSGPDCMYTNIPAPADQYAWKKGGSQSFSWWNVETQTPASDWQLLGKTNVIDNASGIVLEQQGPGGQFSAQIMDEKKRSTIASIANASLSQIACTSFEDAATGNWAWSDGAINTGASKTGDRYMNLGTAGLTKGGLNASERYTVSLWVKSAGGSMTIDGVGSVNLGSLSEWTRFEYTVTGLTSVSVRKSGGADVLVDEVRLHPYSARMNTMTYHPAFGITSQTDHNNQTVYTEYDDAGRPKNLLDEKRNIVKTYLYNFKK